MGRILFTPRRATAPVIYPVKYGLLYNWYAATDVRKITSSDEWVVPRYVKFQLGYDFQILRDFLGSTVAGNKAREVGTDSWKYFAGAIATNESQMTIRGAGIRDKLGVFKDVKVRTELWTNCSNNTTTSILAELAFNSAAGAFPNNAGYGSDYKNQGCSLRLVKTSTTLTHGQTGTYTGNDGKTYRTICIGTQEWLADNLAETKFRNGDWIHGFDGGVYTPISNEEWAALTTAGCCAYNNDLTLI